MHIAKPPGGFHVVERPGVTRLVAAQSQNWPRLPEWWKAIKERLKHAGHKEGVAIRTRQGGRLFKDDGDPPNLPRIRVAYTVLGDTLTIELLSVAHRNVPRPPTETVLIWRARMGVRPADPA